jgi:glycine betaine/proline transport system substrate-binding protein
MNSMLVFMNSKKANGADTAIEFLTRHSNVWTKWVTKDAAKRIKAGL